MDEETRKRKIEYNVERNRQLRKDKIIKTFSCDLDYDFAIEINKFISKNGLTKKDIISKGYYQLKKEIVERKKEI